MTIDHQKLEEPRVAPLSYVRKEGQMSEEDLKRSKVGPNVKTTK